MPILIRGGSKSTQDVLNLASGITKYTDSFEIEGETRGNVLTQPSDFSDESTIVWNPTVSSYFSYSIENIEGSENGNALVLTPANTAGTSIYNTFWFTSTVDSSTSDSRTYLIAVRAKASESITSYYPNLEITYRPTGATNSIILHYSYAPTTEWQTFYVIANIPENRYLYDVTMCFYSRGITHYIDWIAAYDITGTNFGHMTFGADASATTSDVLSGKSFYKNGVKYIGTIKSQGGKMVTPSTDQQLAVEAHKYTSGNVYVAGDNNLKSENIKSGVSIFGVTGTYADKAKVYVAKGINPTAMGSDSTNRSFEISASGISKLIDASNSDTTFPSSLYGVRPMAVIIVAFSQYNKNASLCEAYFTNNTYKYGGALYRYVGTGVSTTTLDPNTTEYLSCNPNASTGNINIYVYVSNAANSLSTSASHNIYIIY